MGRTSDARQRLMDAAYQLIREHSYGAVTIEAICERAQVKKGSFYYFFLSKSDLALASIDTWCQERKAKLEIAFAREVAPLERLRNYLDFISKHQLEAYATTGQILGCPLFTLGSEISTQDEKLRQRICDFMQMMTSLVETAIAEAQAAGDLDGHDAPLRARFFLACYEGVLTRARIENDPESIRTLSADALEMIGARRDLAHA